MICAYLLHCEYCKNVDEVLNFYGEARTVNAKVCPAAGYVPQVLHRCSLADTRGRGLSPWAALLVGWYFSCMV